MESSFNPSSISESSGAPNGSGGTLTYKWQKSTTDASSGFSDIASSNSSTYDPEPLLKQLGIEEVPTDVIEWYSLHECSRENG